MDSLLTSIDANTIDLAPAILPQACTALLHRHMTLATRKPYGAHACHGSILRIIIITFDCELCTLLNPLSPSLVRQAYSANGKVGV